MRADGGGRWIDASDGQGVQAAPLLVGGRGNHRVGEARGDDEGLHLSGLGGHLHRGLERVLKREAVHVAAHRGGARGAVAVEREGLHEDLAHGGVGERGGDVHRCLHDLVERHPYLRVVACVLSGVQFGELLLHLKELS